MNKVYLCTIFYRFLYQIFPGTTLQCQRLLFKAAKTGELDTVQKLVRKLLYSKACFLFCVIRALLMMKLIPR